MSMCVCVCVRLVVAELGCVLMHRSDAGCGYNQLVYSSLVGLEQRDRSLFTDSLVAARSVSQLSSSAVLFCYLPL